MSTATSSPKHIRDDYRRVLALLAASPYGATEAVLLAQGFDQDLLVELARDELVSVREDPVGVGNRTRIGVSSAHHGHRAANVRIAEG
jgi:hypothetical protein